MDFEEFEKRFNEERYYKLCVIGLDLIIQRDYCIWGYIDELGRWGCQLGKYNTLKEAYEALKAICKLNGVEME